MQTLRFFGGFRFGTNKTTSPCRPCRQRRHQQHHRPPPTTNAATRAGTSLARKNGTPLHAARSEAAASAGEVEEKQAKGPEAEAKEAAAVLSSTDGDAASAPEGPSSLSLKTSPEGAVAAAATDDVVVDEQKASVKREAKVHGKCVRVCRESGCPLSVLSARVAARVVWLWQLCAGAFPCVLGCDSRHLQLWSPRMC